MATPSETPREASSRARVIWSFWSAIVLLGLPTWYITTSIYRAALPTNVMLANHDDLWYHIPICLESRTLPQDALLKLASQTQKEAHGPQGLFRFHIEAQKQCPRTSTTSVISIEQGDEHQFGYDSKKGSFQARYPSSDQSSISAHLSGYLQAAFQEEHAAIAYHIFTNGKNNDQIQEFIQGLPQGLTTEIQKSANRAFKPSSDWDVGQSLDQYIEPIAYALSQTSNISIASQIQLYSSFSSTVQPQHSDEGWKLKREHLTSFVNTAEWSLSPSVGTGPTVNFIAYVPEQKYIPLLLEDSLSNSWLVPQWGGITILNPPLIDQEESQLGLKHLPPHLDQQSLVPAFESFQSQLLQLLGVPYSSRLPLQERLKSFQRLSGLSLYIRTSSNLGSLARLAQRLSSIPIPRHVSNYVDHALARLAGFRQCLDAGHATSWSTCLQSAREAFADSEKAFFDKSMVGQVYFPDEHKVAVYLPLLGPIGVPLVIGLIREAKLLLSRKKS